jgi:hypothetical protein
VYSARKLGHESPTTLARMRPAHPSLAGGPSIHHVITRWGALHPSPARGPFIHHPPGGPSSSTRRGALHPARAGGPFIHHPPGGPSSITRRWPTGCPRKVIDYCGACAVLP